MKKTYSFMTILLFVFLFFLSPAINVYAGTVGESGVTQISLAEIWDYNKNNMSYLATQLGCTFSGTMQEKILNEQAWLEWMQDRYANGYDGTPWNAEEYYRKECIRNDDGTFTLSDKYVDDTAAYIKEVLDTNSGYYLLKTVGIKNISPATFFDKDYYNIFLDFFKENKLVYIDTTSTTDLPYFFVDGFDLVFIDSTYTAVGLYKDWKRDYYLYLNYTYADGIPHTSGRPIDKLQISYFGSTNSRPTFRGLVTQDGAYIKIFKTDAAMKEDDVGYQPYYCSQKFQEYNEANDNSVTVDQKTFDNRNWITTNNDIYNDTSQTIITNNTNNTTGMSQAEIMELVDKLMEKFSNNNSGSGGSWNPGSVSGNSDSGGLTSLMDGIGKFLDFILNLIGKLIGVISEFLSAALGLLDGLSSFTGPFSALLSELMPFVPEELWDVIMAGVTLSIIVMVVKSFKS